MSRVASTPRWVGDTARLQGRRFGLLTVEAPAPVDELGRARVAVRCDCGVACVRRVRDLLDLLARGCTRCRGPEHSPLPPQPPMLARLWRDLLADHDVARITHTMAHAAGRTDVQRRAIQAACLRRLRPRLGLQAIATATGEPDVDLDLLAQRICRGRRRVVRVLAAELGDATDEDLVELASFYLVMSASRSDAGRPRRRTSA